MEYGAMIKEARVSLNIYQKDLSNDNISRNLLSNIEKGKTKLTPQKGLLIYQKLMEISLIKSIDIDVCFDELLDDNPKYTALKHAYVVCKDLRSSSLISYDMKEQLVKNAVSFAKKNELGLLKYYIYYFSAKSLNVEKRPDYVIELYFTALEFIKWYETSEIIEMYETCLKEVTLTAYQLKKYDQLAYYYKLLLDFQDTVYQKKDINTLFNIALFSEAACNYSEALKYVNLCLSETPKGRKSDKIDAMIVKATVFTKSGAYQEGINLYIDILSELDDHMLYPMSLCLSNLIHNIVKYKCTDKRKLLEKSLKSLVSMIDDVYEQTTAKHDLLSNIAQGYCFIEEYETSLKYFEKAFEAIQSKESEKSYIVLLTESFVTHKKLGKIDKLILRILNEDLDLSEEDNLKELALLLLKIQFSIQNLKLDDNIINGWNEFILQIEN